MLWSHFTDSAENWGQERGKLLTTVLPHNSCLPRWANWSPLFRKNSKNDRDLFVLCFQIAKSMSFHSASSEGAGTVRIRTFTESLSVPTLSKVLSFCLQSSFIDSLLFALCICQTADYLKFHQVSLCEYRYGSKWKAGIWNLRWATTAQSHRKIKKRSEMYNERKKKEPTILHKYELYMNINIKT